MYPNPDSYTEYPISLLNVVIVEKIISWSLPAGTILASQLAAILTSEYDSAKCTNHGI